MTPNTSLEAANVSRIYEGRPVVDAVSLRLEAGKITALLGQSGAGKSTLLRLFAGLERPDRGVIRLGDQILSSPEKMISAEKRRIGLIFQDFALFPHLTALQNIMFGLSGIPKAQARTRAQTWLTKVGLEARADAYPHQLSGGEQQRIAIARALAPEPIAILMDEPFSGLDPAMREDVRETALNAVREAGTPALLVTHDAREAMLSADHLAVMRDGQISQQDTPEKVYAQPVDKETAAALGPIIITEGRINTQSATIETPFGAFQPQTLPQITPVMVGLRPEAFVLNPASSVKASVLSRRYQGAMIQLQIARNGHRAYILVPAANAPKAHAEVGFALNAALITVFA